MTPAAPRRRLWPLAACGLCLGAALVGFNLLYLSAPAGLGPIYNLAEPPLRAAYAQRVPLPTVEISAKTLARASLALQAGMWCAFFAAILLLRKLRDTPAERSALKLVVAVSAVVSLALIFTPPILSSDVYHYALFGRMIVAHGLNPYVTPIDAIRGDPLWPFSHWTEYSTHYGPVFTGISTLAAAAGAGHPIATAIAFKVLATAFGVLATWSVVALARQQGRSALVPAALLCWNPLVVLETAGSAHNDIVMMGLALAGLAVAGRGRPNLGFALLVGSVHVKWVTGGLLGLVAIARLREIEGGRARARELAKLAAIVVGITVAVYVPFWTGLASITAPTRLLGGGHAVPGPRAAYLIAFLVVVAISAVVVVRSGRRHYLEMAAVVCLAFVAFVFPFTLPWYLLPSIVLLAAGQAIRAPTRPNLALSIITTALALLLMLGWAYIVPIEPHYPTLPTLPTLPPSSTGSR